MCLIKQVYALFLVFLKEIILGIIIFQLNTMSYIPKIIKKI